MANRYWTDNPQRKITAPLPPKDERKGTASSVAFKKVKHHPREGKGLSKNK